MRYTQEHDFSQQFMLSFLQYHTVVLLLDSAKPFLYSHGFVIYNPKFILKNNQGG